MNKYIIRNATLVNEGIEKVSDVLINGDRIELIAQQITHQSKVEEINAEGQYLFPGLIDDQVHFREPGLTHKGDLYTEPKAAVAGGITSFMEMPNTVPGATTLERLEEKFSLAKGRSLANYSFFMGTTPDNLSELLKVNPNNCCGIKIFMGSSTGNMLVDDPQVLENIFSKVSHIIALHCEDDPTIHQNLQAFKEKYGDDIPIRFHPQIRSREACLKSSSFAVSLAKKHGTRLHILHISTEEELALFDQKTPLEQKKITSEACIHHLWFAGEDYESKGNLIKWNPAIKSSSDRAALRKALLNGQIDVIATDHAPHTLEEKSRPYTSAPSGGPLVQHSLLALYDLSLQGVLNVTDIARLASHHPALLFKVAERGFIREGYKADLVLLNPKGKTPVARGHVLYKCGWSPFEGHTFQSAVTATFVNGHLVYRNGLFDESHTGERLVFNN
jgi:dihydroorotase